MRRALLLLSVLCVALTAFAPVPTSSEGPATCRADGAVVHTGVLSTVTCFALGTEDFDVEVVVTLQRPGRDGWQDVASETCTGSSTNHAALVPCDVVLTDVVTTTTYRALVDIVAPNDLEPVELRPTKQGTLIVDALADDECGVNEAVETYDATAPDLPWADICAVTMSHELRDAGDQVELASITVTVHVAGMLDSRAGTSDWEAELQTADCRHQVEVTDDGVIGAAGARVVSLCFPEPDEGCGGVIGLITDITGGSCTSSNPYAFESTTDLPAGSVSFTDTEVRVTFDPATLDAVVAADLAAGATVERTEGRSSTGVGSTTTATRYTLDVDFAWTNGRSYTFG